MIKRAKARLARAVFQSFRCCRGSSAIELALVLPILLLFICGTIEFGLILYAESVLDGGLATAAREGSTGNTGGQATQYDYILSILDSHIKGLLLDPSQVNVNVSSVSDFSSIRNPVQCMNYKGAPPPPPPRPPQCRQNLGTAGSVVIYTANYPWHVVTPFLQSILDSSIPREQKVPGIFMLTASSVVQNEPYSASR